VWLTDCALDDAPVAGETSYDIAASVGGITVTGRVMHAPIPEGAFVILKTLYLRRFESLTLDLAQGPIDVDGALAASYRPGHHNFTATVLVEPAFDPALSDEERQQLVDADIRQVMVDDPLDDLGFGDPRIWIVGLDGAVRVPTD
jgi:hypothetical protein